MQLICAAGLPLTIVINWLNCLPTLRLTQLTNDVELAELAAAAREPCNRQAADRWYKGLDDQPTDESGRIVPYKNNYLANHG